MSIKQHLTTALNGIIAEQERAISQAKEKANIEIVAPKFKELENAKNQAITEIVNSHQEAVAKMSEQLQERKNEIHQACEKKKAEFADSVISIETSTVKEKYRVHIQKLEEQISTIEE